MEDFIMTIHSKFKAYRIVPLEDRIVLDAEIAQEANDLMDIELFDALVDELAEVNTLAQEKIQRFFYWLRVLKIPTLFTKKEKN